MKPEQILIINDFGFVNGGAARIAIQSAQALAARGLEVTFFSGSGSFAEEMAASPIKLVSAGQSEFAKDRFRVRGAVRAFWNHSTRRALEKVLATFDPERSIVHIHTWMAAHSASIFGPLLHRRLPVVVTLHDYLIACPNGAFTVFPKAETCSAHPLSWGCLTTNCDPKTFAHKTFKIGRQWIQKRFGGIPRGVENFIFVSDFSRQLLEKHLPSRAKLFDLPNPIHFSKPEPVDVRNNRGWAFVGRLSPEKGCRLFAEAAARMKLDAVFIGDGEEKEAVRRIYPEAEMKGWLQGENLIKAMGQVRGLVFPSLCLESAPLAVSEALAMGLPAIVSSGTAGADLLIPGETGLIFRKNDVADLADKIGRLENDPDLRVRMGRRAFELYWEKPETLEKHVDDLLEIYRSVA